MSKQQDQLNVYLMRGLPSCGKSHTARALAGQGGVVLETDRYFFECVGSDQDSYNYRKELLPVARQWNFERYCNAIINRVSPIVVDRGNGLNLETKRYAVFAIENGYSVEFRYPDSEWWNEISVLLKYKQHTGQVLDDWADRLASMNRLTHRTPASTIRRWMDRWKHDLTIEKVLAYQGS